MILLHIVFSSDAKLIACWQSVAMFRDDVLQRQIRFQHERYIKQEEPAEIAADSVVAVRTSGHHGVLGPTTPYSKQRKRVVGVLQEPLSSNVHAARKVRVRVHGSHADQRISASKLSVWRMLDEGH